MKPILYIAVILLLSVNFVLNLPRAVDLAQVKLASANSLENNIFKPGGEIAGVEKASLPWKSLGLAAPVVSATSVLVMDPESGFIFFTKDPNKRVPIASTTKLMTALVAADSFAQTQVLTVPETGVAGSTMGLKAGEKLTFRSLLYGMLLNSGNDAAYTIAANFPGGVNAFVEAMNSKVKDLGLVNTHFDNPAGFDSANHYSSAYDLARIAVAASENPLLARAVATKEATVASVDHDIVHQLKNLNKLLNLPGVLGMKTGTTPAARENLVGLMVVDGHKILTVVLGSDDRFTETEQLVDWVHSNFTWQ